jgi:hypothetical protein
MGTYNILAGDLVNVLQVLNRDLAAVAEEAITLVELGGSGGLGQLQKRR